MAAFSPALVTDPARPCDNDQRRSGDGLLVFVVRVRLIPQDERDNLFRRHLAWFQARLSACSIEIEAHMVGPAKVLTIEFQPFAICGSVHGDAPGGIGKISSRIARWYVRESSEKRVKRPGVSHRSSRTSASLLPLR